MEIDCDRCELRGTGCQDCVIAVLQPRNAAGISAAAPGHLTDAEVKALGVLAAAGLVPPLRLSLPGLSLPGASLPGLSLPGVSAPGPAVLPGMRAWAQRAFPETKAS